MKTYPAHGSFILSVILALGLSGCETDNSTPAAATPQAAIAPAAAGVNTVKMTVETNTPGATVTANGVRIGYTPVDLHVAANPDGALLFAVRVSVQGTGAGSSGSANYVVGDKLPARLSFNGTFKNESRDLAKFDTKPTPANVQRE